MITLKPSMEKFLLGSTNTEIQYQQRHILLHTRMLQECCYIQMESLQCKTIIHLFCRKVVFLISHYCHFLCVGQGMNQT
jgi:hypothetical protein